MSVATVTTGTLSFGDGVPKICVPLVGTDISQLTEQAGKVIASGADFVEWRSDCFELSTDIDETLSALKQINAILDGIPLLFTFRSLEQGGTKSVQPEDYRRMCMEAVQSGLIQLLDIEHSCNRVLRRELVDWAKRHDVISVVSSHDFHATPPPLEIQRILGELHATGGDIAKLAVMPTCPGDVLALMSATERYIRTAPRPVITMSMGGLGVTSRIACSLTGSAATFGSLDRWSASAPGQIPAKKLRKIMTSI